MVLYNWSNFIDPEVLVDFEAETGIKVVEEIFDSNETVRAKLIAGADGYDVIIPSGVMIELLIRENLLLELEQDQLPHLKNIDPRFRQLYFDPQDRYSAAYLWGTTGIGYREDLVDRKPDSWKVLFAEEYLEKYRGRITILDDAREAMGAALQYLGYSVNSTSTSEVDAAVALLKKQKRYLSRYDSEVYADFLVSGDLLAAQGWGGTFTKAKPKHPKLRYAIPSEGGILGVDCMVIPRSSRHPAEAHRLINFLLRADIAARIVNKTFYPSANAAAKPLIKPEILSDLEIYPSDAQMAKMEWLRDVRAANVLYEKGWERIRYTH